jgi:hypothetical protein
MLSGKPYDDNRRTRESRRSVFLSSSASPHPSSTRSTQHDCTSVHRFIRFLIPLSQEQDFMTVVTPIVPPNAPHFAASPAAQVSSRSRLPLGLTLLTLMGILALPVACTAQAAAPAQPLVPPSAAHEITPAPADPAIAAALKQVSPERIQAIITRLVGFNNRSTVSSIDTDLAPGTGVLPAADWIESQFKGQA